MNTLNPTAADVASSLFDIEIMVRQAIADGTILDVMMTQKDKIVSHYFNPNVFFTLLEPAACDLCSWQ